MFNDIATYPEVGFVSEWATAIAVGGGILFVLERCALWPYKSYNN
jgi:hypothetical protein